MRYPKAPQGPETKEQREARLFEGQKIQEKRWQGWVHFGSYGLDLGVSEQLDFMDELEQLADALSDSPEWCAWWAPVERPRLTLSCFFTTEPATKPWSRRTDEEVPVHLSFTLNPGELLSREHARAVVMDTFDRMRRRYGLADLPPLPTTDGGPAEHIEEEQIDLTPDVQAKMPRIWTENDLIFVQCPTCGAVSPGYRSSAGIRWFNRHVRASHPEYGWK